MSETLHALARDLSVGSPSLETSWLAVLQRMESLGLDSRRMSVLARSASSPMLLLTFADLCAPDRLGAYANAEAALVTLNHMVEVSPADLKSWLQALRQLHLFLQQRQRSCTLSHALGYIECTSDVLASQPVKMGLADAVQEMLSTYGFSYAEEK